MKGGQGEELPITSVTDRSFHLKSLRDGGAWGLGDSTMGWLLTVGKAWTPPNHSCCRRPEAQPSAPFWLAETSPLKIANERGAVHGLGSQKVTAEVGVCHLGS